MTQLKNGGPAFPSVAENWHKEGMSMRDYFAAKAMVAFMQQNCSVEFTKDMDMIAALSYSVADAMLRERGQ